MLNNQKSINNFRIVSDLILLNASFLIAAVLAQSFELLIERSHLFVLLLFLNITWFLNGSLLRLYKSNLYQGLPSQISKIAKNIITQLVVAILFLFVVKENLFTRYFIFYFTVILTSTVIIKEFLLKSYFFKSARVKNVVIVGANELGKNFRELVETNGELGLRFTGFVDESLNHPDVIGDIEHLDETISSSNIGSVVIALPLEKSFLIDKVLRVCDKAAVNAFIIPDYLRYVSSKFQVSFLDKIPIITVRNNPLDEVQWRILKRGFDLLFSSLLFLLVLWWFLPLMGIIIKLNSKGPVFFVQDRVGQNNETFRCIKFRTMTTEASRQKDVMNPVGKGDNRVTAVGKFLRKTNLDELPQFINVLKGDMSVVGPRPHAIPFDNTYGEIVEEIKLRHRVKPGISGWAQVHGLRGDVFDFEENKIRTRKRIEYDIWYIENWSVALDIQIIFETVMQMLTGKNMGY